MFSQGCLILFIGAMHPEDGSFHMGFPHPPPARIQTVNGRAFNRHFFDLPTQISYFRVTINYKKKFQGMDIILSITEWIVSNFSQ